MTALAADCLAAADSVAARLARTAEWAGSACTWSVVTPDIVGARARRALHRPAGASLYQGTAGIALFLAELYGVTGADTARKLARGALNHALNECESLRPDAFGFYSGRVGVAHALTRFAATTGETDAKHQARAVLTPLFGNEASDRGLDIIGGAAGAIPALLTLASTLDFPAARTSAEALGEHLFAAADRQPNGWSWPTPIPGTARNLCGLGHGAAGMAAGLLELWAATGVARYRYAAERAFDYETFHFEESVGNWPDFRDGQWSEILAVPEQLDRVRTTVRAGGDVPRHTKSFMVGWCHGAPGIALSRLRGFELSRRPDLAEQARIGIETTRQDLSLPRANYSLCHGVLGNCETLLRGAKVLDSPEWLRDVEDAVAEAIAVALRGERWRSGALSALPEQSLLLGDAGAAHFLLRVTHPEIPSVLALTAPDAGIPAGAVEDYQRQREELVAAECDVWFGRTRRVFSRFGASPDLQPIATQPVIAFSERLERLVTSGHEMNEFTESTADASRLERAVFAATCALPDFIDEMLVDFRRLDESPIPWADVRLRLAPGTELVECRYDWDSWLEVGGAVAGRPSADPRTFVVYRHRRTIRYERATRFATAILTLVRDAAGGITCDEAVSALSDLTGGEVSATQATALVRQQLERARRAGIIVCAPLDASASSGAPIQTSSTADAN